MIFIDKYKKTRDILFLQIHKKLDKYLSLINIKKTLNVYN